MYVKNGDTETAGLLILNAKRGLYLKTIFGCSYYVGGDLWDRRLKKQVPFTYILVD